MANEAQLFELAKGAYERSRLRLAAQVALPVALLPAVSWWLGTPLKSASGLGAGLVAVVALCLWRGGALSRGSMTGLKSGLVPLLFAHTAKLFGHVCSPSGCTTLCVPACAAGGVLAGALIEYWARTSSRPNVTRGLGLGVAVLTGALGCSCVGASGVLALIVGAVSSAAAARLVPART
jgi:hypothetical protein